MDQKLVCNFEVKKNDRVYSLHMPVGAPIGEAYDAVFEMLQEILELSKKAVENAKVKEAADVTVAD